MGRRWSHGSSFTQVRWATLLAASLACAACSGGNELVGDGTGVGSAPCDGFCYDTPTALSVEEIQRLIAQAVQEARAQGMPATIAVADRAGNVLAVYRMAGAPATVRIGSPDVNGRVDGGLEGISLVPSELSAIAKAITAAFLSSEGNAFSTRTASQIVQANFNPGEGNQPGGPLFGVQFSQLPCSDLSTRFVTGAGPSPGPHRSPLGLAADPGGLPLFKNGTVVGGIGVEADGRYTLDPSLLDHDRDVDELIATAGTFGFAAPVDRRADRITVDGKTLRFSDVGFGDLASTPAAAPAFSSLTAEVGALVPVRGYTQDPPTIVAGTAFGQNASGFAPAPLTDPQFAAEDAFFLVDAAGNNRYPARDSTVGDLSADEVRSVMLSALRVANRARAQIRRPLGSSARVTISVVDTRGDILGIVRSRDAPVFGTDVSLQKARNAVLFSSSDAGAILRALPPAGYLMPDQATPAELRRVDIGRYVSDLQSFLGRPTALDDGAIAFTDRAVGNLARPFFPDGIQGTPHGPLSKPAGEWSPFSDGLQLDLVYNAVIRHVAFVAGLPVDDVPQNCSGIEPLEDGLGVANAAPQLRNGIQIFPGSVPLYRGGTLVGAIGISGDGVDQDDMIGFLGAHEAGGAIGNAPPAIRSDQVEVDGVRLRYVQCPQAPFLDTDEQEVCNGL
ncbi:GlcG/HbpS family heme-binding protein [Sinimarinibacterium thermocellulolyticum]|uniref:Heme-binding protein n=1 Tax=Sinimarinibacterium thermocellulolyticum TaxID=3170016 RepID=A0ABV2A6A2_9GAMM